MSTRKPRNIRFWAWGNHGLVKITLRPGQILTWHEGGVFRKKNSYKSTTWEHTGDGIEKLIQAKMYDCTGLRAYYEVYYSTISDLESQTFYPTTMRFERGPGIKTPLWKVMYSPFKDCLFPEIGN